jgi:hypothetical protein
MLLASGNSSSMFLKPAAVLFAVKTVVLFLRTLHPCISWLHSIYPDSIPDSLNPSPGYPDSTPYILTPSPGCPDCTSYICNEAPFNVNYIVGVESHAKALLFKAFQVAFNCDFTISHSGIHNISSLKQAHYIEIRSIYGWKPSYCLITAINRLHC